MLRLGQPCPSNEMDKFMLVEGYEPAARSYQPVIGCWCGGTELDQRPVGVAPGFKHYQRCTSCQCLLLKLVLSPSRLSELYGPRYFREHQQAIGLPPIEVRYRNDVHDRIPIWLDRVAELAPQAARVLEVGSSNGRFVQELEGRGYRVVGLELDGEVATWAREKTGCDIRACELKDLADYAFDVVIANDVLEHVYDPLGLVGEALCHLNSGGVAMFQTVIFEHPSQCPPSMLRPLYHTILYSSNSLSRLNSPTGVIEATVQGAFGYRFIVLRRA